MADKENQVANETATDTEKKPAAKKAPAKKATAKKADPVVMDEIPKTTDVVAAALKEVKKAQKAMKDAEDALAKKAKASTTKKAKAEAVEGEEKPKKAPAKKATAAKAEAVEGEEKPKKAPAKKATTKKAEVAATSDTDKVEEKKAPAKKATTKKAETADKAEPVKKAPAKKAEPKAEKVKAEPAKAEKVEKPAPVKKSEPVKVAKEEPKAPAKATKPATERKTVSKANADRYRLKDKYAKEVVPALVKEFGYKNTNQAPKLDKITLNMRIGDIKDNSKSIQTAQRELEAICGQKCVIVKAKKSVANFKLRENQPIGIKVTLRGDRMYEFFDRLVAIALPRVRDFRGLSDKSFDGRGNYAMGVKEQIMFPEIAYELVEKVRGFDICIVTTAQNDNEAKVFLQKMGMPFKS